MSGMQCRLGVWGLFRSVFGRDSKIWIYHGVWSLFRSVENQKYGSITSALYEKVRYASITVFC